MRILAFSRRAGRIILAGIVAAAIVSLLLCAYSITPVHEDNPNGSTDYVWPSNAVWVKMTEGTSWGRFDANGYNNSEVIESPDILVVGSSHVEAINVLQDQNMAYLLGEKLEDKYRIYNIGISDHPLMKTCQYLERDVQLYGENLKIIVIEAPSVTITQNNVEQLLNGTVERSESHSTGLIAILQKIPFCRLTYQQIAGGLLDLFMPSKTEPEEKKEEVVDESVYSEFFSYLAQVEEQSNVQLILFYHPTETLMEDGSIRFPNGRDLEFFRENAEKYGINFIDMTSAFEDIYYTDHHVPHGFANGRLGAGHLNKYGHEAIARCLYDEIAAMEEAGLLCK